MSIFQLTSEIRVTCPKHGAPWLRKEIEGLGYAPIGEDATGVTIKGSLRDCMRLNLWLRTAYRVLFLLDEFEAPNPDALYDRLRDIPWEAYIPGNGYFSIQSSVENIHIKDTRFANLRVKDAVVDRLQAKNGIRPDTGPDTNRTVLFLFWKNEDAKIFIDTSGETIARHGYRRNPFKAPMQETLAAAALLAMGYEGQTNLVNPMCGSGTVVIEAAMMLTNKAPGLLRHNYGFMHLLGYDSAGWQVLRDEATNAEKPLSKSIRLIASDINRQAIQAAEENAKAADVRHLIDFQVCTFERTKFPKGEGFLFFNPPYGERLGEQEELAPMYKYLGDFLKTHCQGMKAFIFTGNPELAKHIGLRPSRKIPFYNGKIECRLLAFELYAGSKKGVSQT